MGNYNEYAFSTLKKHLPNNFSKITFDHHTVLIKYGYKKILENEIEPSQMIEQNLELSIFFKDIMQKNHNRLLIPISSVPKISKFTSRLEEGQYGEHKLIRLEDKNNLLIDNLHSLRKAKTLNSSVEFNDPKLPLIKEITRLVNLFYINEFKNGNSKYFDNERQNQENIPHIITHAYNSSPINLLTRNYYSIKIIGGVMQFFSKPGFKKKFQYNDASRNIDIYKINSNNTFTHLYNPAQFVRNEKKDLNDFLYEYKDFISEKRYNFIDDIKKREEKK